MYKRFFILFIFFSLILHACKDQPCKNTNCSNAGIVTYNQGNCYCECPASTLGENCQIDLMDSIATNYSIIDSCTSGITSGFIDLIRSDSNVFDVSGLGNMPVPYNNCMIHIKLLEKNIQIDSQFLCNESSASDSYLIFGNGNIDYDLFTLEIDYFITHLMGASNQIDTCTVYMKK